MKFKSIFLTWFCLLALGLSAQDYKIEHLSLEEGLSQSIVYSITQDHKGFMWLGTQDGLNRYDGYSFKVYKPQPFDTTSLRNNSITALLTDRNGQLWVGTAWGGLHLYDPIHDHFRRFQWKDADNALTSNEIIGLHEGSQGIWVATANGFNLMKVTGDNAQNYQVNFQRFLYDTTPERGEVGNRIRTLFEDSKGDLWLYCQKELLKYEFSQIQDFVEPPIVCYKNDTNNSQSISSNYISGFAEDKNGNLWIATGYGLNRYWREKDSFEQFFQDSPKHTGFLTDKFVNIISASNGDLWLATNGQGVSRIKAASLPPSNEVTQLLEVEHYTADHTKNPLSSNYIETIYEDEWNEGVIWVGTVLGGASKLIPRTKHFNSLYLKDSPFNQWVSSSAVFCTFKDQKDRLWMGTEEGILVYPTQQNQTPQLITADPKNPNALKNNFCTSIISDYAGNMWIGSGHGLYKVEETSSNQFQFKRFHPSEDCRDRAATAVYSAPNGLLYIGTWSGMTVFNPISDEMLNCPIVLDTLAYESKGYKISDFLQDDEGNLWIATFYGLVLIEDFENVWEDCNIYSNLKIYRHEENMPNSFWDNYIVDLEQDDAGDIWAATSSGIVRIFQENGNLQFEPFTEKDGLSNNMVYGILKDPKTGNFWLSSNGGITKFNPIKKTFDNYSLQDGLQSNEFNGGALSLAHDGEMIFGGINGITRFYPQEIQYDIIPPMVWITALINADLEEYNLLHQPEQIIEFPYGKSHFSIEFLAIDYANPNENQYTYQLEGLHNDWIDSGTNRRVNFSDLSPGNYTFHVKAANGDGIWNEQAASVQIVILPPFWMTLWFYGLVLFVILGMLWYLHQASVRRKVEKVVEIEKIRKSAAADFHDELGHKLTIISLFSEIVKNKLNGKVDEEVSPHLNKVIKTSNELYFSMKDLLWALDPSKDSIYDLAIMLKDFGDELFDKTGVHFHSEGIEPILKTRKLPMHYKRHIVLIFKEAMNNTLKHAKCQNTLLAFDYNGNGHLAISFKDDGQGFEIPKVNEGNGLLNIQDRAERINADLVIVPENEGTKVVLECDLEAEVKNYF